MRKIISIDVGGTFIKYGLVDEAGNVLCKNKMETIQKTAEGFVNELCEIANLYKEHKDILGIAISMPGFINNIEGIPLVCSVLRFIEGYKLQEELSLRTNLKVRIENDANCVALAEKFSGNARECEDFICITIGTGIGGGIYLNNKLIRGKQFKGGEFCYMITKDKAGYQKLNENSSMTALIKMYKEYKNISAMEKVLGSDIFKEAEKDEDIKAIINEWYGNIARMIYNVSSMLNPEKILIGGGVSAREELISELQNALNEIPWWKHVSCTIEKCKHENDAGLIGAAYNFINP
ncbi:ROK family protein [Clostridium sp. NSJ-49]|uniref:ROK family protein n=1 Tax=unclassified Clostridium TaxID=2614128 RepID=UPI00164C57AF|nr:MULTISPECIES: ROK family protein [unclassified Clostridium]MBC5625764.1 ROK family protein [Clostridium sp. NSJ-49]MCD2503070.1 ROK family protein [Clostridium sp. NSJ-145]